jgi:hypothetical protein
MAKKRDAAVNVPRAVMAHAGVIGAKARKPAAVKQRAVSPPLDIPDIEALIPDALAIRVAKDYETDADLFREVAGCVLRWAQVLPDSGNKKSAATLKHARERAEIAKDMVGFATGAGQRPNKPTAPRWAALVEAAIHAGAAFSLSVDHFRVRAPQAKSARRKGKEKGASTRDRVRDEAEKLPRAISKAEASRRIGDKIGRTPGRVADLLAEMYPGDSWKKRGIG